MSTDFGVVDVSGSARLVFALGGPPELVAWYNK